MTIDEFLKKYCYNGHDPANCHLRQDLEALLAIRVALERNRCAVVARDATDPFEGLKIADEIMKGKSVTEYLEPHA